MQWINTPTPPQFTEGWTPLHLSCKVQMMCSGANEMFKYLLAQGADLNVVTKSGISILHKAAIDDNTYILTYLRDKCNFPMNQTDNYGNTALHFACMESSNFAAYWLIAFGLSLNAKNNNCDTPLHAAIKSKHLKNTKIVRDLIFKGVDKDIKNN